jgi:hypothetical protein
LAAALLGAAVTGGAVWFFPNPGPSPVPVPVPVPETALVVENRLTEAIALTLEDTGLTIAPGARARVPVERGQPLEAHWAMVQPSSPQGRQLGGSVEGMILAERAAGEMVRVVDAGREGEGWIAPLVTNLAGRPLAALVVTDGDTVDCGCVVPSGGTMHLGYYRAAGGTAVLLADSAGWSARVGALEAVRDSVTGTARVRVDSATLRPPPRPAVPNRRRRPPRATPPSQDPLGSFLPVR